MVVKKNNFIFEPGTGHVKVEVQPGLDTAWGEKTPEAEAGGRRWRAAFCGAHLLGRGAVATAAGSKRGRSCWIALGRASGKFPPGGFLWLHGYEMPSHPRLRNASCHFAD